MILAVLEPPIEQLRISPPSPCRKAIQVLVSTAIIGRPSDRLRSARSEPCPGARAARRSLRRKQQLQAGTTVCVMPLPLARCALSRSSGHLDGDLARCFHDASSVPYQIPALNMGLSKNAGLAHAGRRGSVCPHWES